MTLDLIEMGRKAAEEGVSVPEQIEAEIAEAEADKRTYDALITDHQKRIAHLKSDIERCVREKQRAHQDLRRLRQFRADLQEEETAR